MKIKVKNCSSCPFCNKNEYGKRTCNILTLNNYEILPENKRHKNCPLNVSIIQIQEESNLH